MFHLKKRIVLIGFTFFFAACDKDIEAPTPLPHKEVVKEEKEKTKKETNITNSTIPFLAKEGFLSVNGISVSPKDFNEKMKLLGAFSSVISETELDEFVGQSLDDLTHRTLLRQLIKGQKVDKNDVDKKLSEIKKSTSNFEEHLQKLGQSEEELRIEIEESMKATAFIDAKIQISEKELRSLYKKNLRNYRQDAQVRASHIFFETKDPKDKKKILKKAKKVWEKTKSKGADFASLAKQYSSGPTKKKGGDLGWFTKKRMLPRFSKVAFKLKVGQVSAPVWTERGYHIIKVEAKKKAIVQPFEKVEKRIRKTLLAKKRADKIRELVREAKAKGKIVQNDKLIVRNPDFKKAKGIKKNLPQKVLLPK